MAEVSANLFAMPAGQKILAYHGDSTIWGQYNNQQVAAPAPSFVQLAGFTVQNLGLNGDSTPDALDGVPGRAPWATLMQSSTAHVVIINYGINDRNRDMPLATYKANLEQIADIVKANHKMLILETPNPVNLAHAIPMEDYAQTMRDVAVSRNLFVIDQFAYLTGIIGTNSINSYMPDGAHPNPATYQLKGEFANQELSKVLCQ